MGGHYLPLSVYANKSFDANVIEQKCTDFEEHEVLGCRYRVNVKAAHSKTIEDAVRTELHSGRKKKKTQTKKKGKGSGHSRSRSRVRSDSESSEPSAARHRRRSPDKKRSPSQRRSAARKTRNKIPRSF